MKIKCIETKDGSEHYLTAGKTYDFELAGFHKIIPAGRIIDDVGDKIFILIHNSGHGKFEVVEE